MEILIFVAFYLYYSFILGFLAACILDYKEYEDDSFLEEILEENWEYLLNSIKRVYRHYDLEDFHGMCLLIILGWMFFLFYLFVPKKYLLQKSHA